MRNVVNLCAVGLLGVAAAVVVKAGILGAPRPGPAAAAVANEAPATAGQARAIALSADRHGHFHVEAAVDGRSLRMLVDTGATQCSFAEEDAARVGIVVGSRDFTRVVSTANGLMKVAPVKIASIRVGSITVRDVEAVIVPRGRLSTNLLGMSFLRRLRDFGVSDNTLTLRG